MKTKEVIDPKFVSLEKLNQKSKPKSLRPMRSMVAVRSLKPRTNVATLTVKTEGMEERN
ncbi:MAG: hypothetical protein ACLGHN_04230 [Bacteriovoracia bacterium]